MSFCKNCGTNMENGVKFCPSCGSFAETATGNAAAGTSAEQADAANNKAMGILAYIIFLIPLLAARDSKFARYHTNQGVILAILAVAYAVVYSVLSSLLFFISVPLAFAVTGILGILGWAFLVFSIIGIVNVCKGECKPLPLIGKFQILK